MVLGVGEALDGERAHEAVVELRPGAVDAELRAVTFVMVPGVPRAEPDRGASLAAPLCVHER